MALSPNREQQQSFIQQDMLDSRSSLVTREPSGDVVLLPSGSQYYTSGHDSTRSIITYPQPFYSEGNYVSGQITNHPVMYPLPDPVAMPSSSHHSNSNTSSAYSGEDGYEGGSYGGGVQRKSLKRCQNRGASTRYRLKKRAEYTAMQQKEAELKGRNVELRGVVEDLSIKITYLKSCLKTAMQGCKAVETS
jgi:hypothetical protein